MKRFSLVLCFAVLVTGFWFGCKAKQSPQFALKDVVADGPEFSGLKLQMQADKEQGAIIATFSFRGSNFKPGDKVTLVYDVVSNGTGKIGCSKLRQKTVVALKGQGESGTFKVKVNPKIFNDPIQPDPNDSAKWDMSSGTLWNGPMKVEGCFISPQGQLLAQSSATPGVSGNEGFALQETGARINMHADLCAAKLGALPAFDCLDDRYFSDIPVQVTKNGSTEKISERVERCDHPIYLPTGSHGSCKPWARIGRIPTGDSSFAAVVCRRYWPESGGAPNSGGAASGVPREFLTSESANVPLSTDSWKRNPSGPTDPYFNDVAVIQHNSDSGETCFFQALGVLYGGRVPPPTERELPAEVQQEHPTAKTAEAFWLTPEVTAGINCINCHDADPWMHSPYVRQVERDGETWLPSTYDISDPEKYIIIGKEFGFGKWPATYSITPENDKCMGCHQIGSLGGCERWAEDSGSGNHYTMYKSEFGSTFPQSHWMPPGTSGTLEKWNDRWGAGHKAIVDCCNVKDASGNRILGHEGMFSNSARYGQELSSDQIETLKNAGCSADRRSYIQ